LTIDDLNTKVIIKGSRPVHEQRLIGFIPPSIGICRAFSLKKEDGRKKSKSGAQAFLNADSGFWLLASPFLPEKLANLKMFDTEFLRRSYL
jgi:hypothetical protein